MKNQNKQNFTYAAVNKFAAKKLKKDSSYLLVKKAFLLTVAFVFTIEYGIAQQPSFAQNKNIVAVPSDFGNPNGFGSLSAQIEDKSEMADILEVKGSFDGTVKDFMGVYSAQLILDNKVIAVQTSKVKKSFSFILKRDMLYTIKVEKEGCIPKLVSISTILADAIDERNSYEFSFETNLLSEDLRGNFDDDDVDFPTALISYNKDCDCFEHNKQYTASLIQRMINNVFFGS